MYPCLIFTYGKPNLYQFDKLLTFSQIYLYLQLGKNECIGYAFIRVSHGGYTHYMSYPTLSNPIHARHIYYRYRPNQTTWTSMGVHP